MEALLKATGTTEGDRKPQTVVQIIRCLILGRYTTRVVAGELEIEGPQPLAGPLPDSIKARRDEIVRFLNKECGGTWPPRKREPMTPEEREAETLDEIAGGLLDAQHEDEDLYVGGAR